MVEIGQIYEDAAGAREPGRRLTVVAKNPSYATCSIDGEKEHEVYIDLDRLSSTAYRLVPA